MNAGRDVEQLLSHWLVEEAEVRAPDRVLDAARRTIDRTVQRRWIAAWREPMTLSLSRLAAIAATLVLALAGAAWMGRSTAPVGGDIPSSSPSLTASPTGAAVTIGTYRIARDQVCERYAAELNPLKETMTGIYDPKTSAAARATMLATMQHMRDRIAAMTDELEALAPPPDVAADHAQDIADYRSIVTLILEAVNAARAGDLSRAASMDLATDPFASRIASFESKYLLANCA